MESKRRKLNGYILIYNPSSKYCMDSENWKGWVYEHISTIETRIGNIPEGFEVHHLDGNKENNRNDNLILLSKNDHTRLHNWLQSCDLDLKKLSENRMNSGKPKLYNCKQCGTTLFGSQTMFCSISCQNKNASKKPESYLLKGKTLNNVAEEYEVTKKTARKWFHSYNMTWQS